MPGVGTCLNKGEEEGAEGMQYETAASVSYLLGRCDIRSGEIIYYLLLLLLVDLDWRFGTG